MGKNEKQLGAYELSVVHEALIEYARMHKDVVAKRQAFDLADKFLNASSASVTHEKK